MLKRMHPTSRFVLSQQGVQVWHVMPDQPPSRISTVEQVAAIKQDVRMGYNFFAHKHDSAWSSVFDS
jgi:hypothetical protein